MCAHLNVGLCPQVVDLCGPDCVHDVDQAVTVYQVTVVQDHLALYKELLVTPYSLMVTGYPGLPNDYWVLSDENCLISFGGFALG